MVQAPRSCKTCRFLDVQPTAAGKRIVHEWCRYPCLAPIPDMPPDMPASVMKGWLSWQWPDSNDKSRMEGSDGTECGAWEKWGEPAA